MSVMGTSKNLIKIFLKFWSKLAKRSLNQTETQYEEKNPGLTIFVCILVILKIGLDRCKVGKYVVGRIKVISRRIPFECRI